MRRQETADLTLSRSLEARSYSTRKVELTEPILRHHRARTHDGIGLYLKQYVPRPISLSPDVLDSMPTTPVILCHGLAGNSNPFDEKKEESLAGALLERGYTVWLANLRSENRYQISCLKSRHRRFFDKHYQINPIITEALGWATVRPITNPGPWMITSTSTCPTLLITSVTCTMTCHKSIGWAILLAALSCCAPWQTQHRHCNPTWSRWWRLVCIQCRVFNEILFTYLDSNHHM